MSGPATFLEHYTKGQFAPYVKQQKLVCSAGEALLETADIPVTQIAFEVGYESSQALARLFRRAVGLSPSEYRREHR